LLAGTVWYKEPSLILFFGWQPVVTLYAIFFGFHNQYTGRPTVDIDPYIPVTFSSHFPPDAAIRNAWPNPDACAHLTGDFGPFVSFHDGAFDFSLAAKEWARLH
jgi:hypothetical protein